MALRSSTSIVTNGLIFYYDMNNPRGYVGPPLTNILPNGINAGYPTSPTGWGTYNTNQYGSGNYFSIGTISDVTNNIVTCPNHLLRTYDVVQPQTTGGGVTSGTNYLVRKWDSNTFSLYSYDSTQDSTDIFQAHVNLNTDNRVSVSSGITNMWWGYPHLPNSGIMKQTITNGFQYKGRIHDCIRIHWYRPDGVTDGMAYGNEPTITAGQTYTISFYHRAATPNCVGYSATINRWTNGEYTSDSFTVGKNWKKHSYTFTTSQSGTTYFYWFNGNMPAQCAWDLSEIMIYQGSGSSEYVPSNTTRSNTQAILDLTNNNTITATSLTYASDGTFSFNGTNNSLSTNINIDTTPALSPWTYEVWTRLSSFPTATTPNSYGITYRSGVLFGATYYSGAALYWYGNSSGNGCEMYGFLRGNDAYRNTSGFSMQVDTWYHFVMVNDYPNAIRLFVNGSQYGTTPCATEQYNPSFNAGNIGVSLAQIDGGGTANYSHYPGQVSIAKIYNRALSATEVLQNFNAQRGIYGV